MTLETFLPLFLCLYLLFLIGVGYMASKYMRNLEDYVLAGRRVGAWALAFTFSATGMSGWLGLGFAGYTYRSGFEGVWTMIPSATVGILLSFVLISKLIRRYSEDVNALTVPDVLEDRYYDRSRVLRIIAAVIILAASISYVNGQLVACGKLFSTVLGWDFRTTVIVAAVVFVAWTSLGGLLAVSWTDFVQGILMVCGTAMAGILGLKLAGGLGNLSVELARVAQNDPAFYISPFATIPMVVYGISLFLGDGIMSWVGQPTLMMRYMSAKDTKTLTLSALLAVFVQSILFFGVFFAALAMRANFPSPESLPFGSDTETVLLQFFRAMTHPIIAGIFMGSVLASILSTADSMLLIGASTLVNDIYVKIFRPDVSPRQALLYSRLATITLGVVGVLLSLRGGSVLWISWFGWNTLGLFGGPVVLGLLWPRTTRQGAIAGLVTGFILLAMWGPLNLEARLNLFQAFAGCLATYLVTWVVSLLTPAPPIEIESRIRQLHANRLGKGGTVAA